MTHFIMVLVPAEATLWLYQLWSCSVGHCGLKPPKYVGSGASWEGLKCRHRLARACTGLGAAW